MSAENFTYKTEEKFINEPKNYMSDIVPKEQQVKSIELAENHVDWLLSIMRPLLIEEFCHGYRHGWENAENIYIYDEEENK